MQGQPPPTPTPPHTSKPEQAVVQYSACSQLVPVNPVLSICLRSLLRKKKNQQLIYPAQCVCVRAWAFPLHFLSQASSPCMGSLTKIKVFCEKCFSSISSLLSRLLFQDPWRRSFWPLISPAYLHHLSALSPPSPITSTNLAFPLAGITEVNAVTMYFCHNVFFFNSVSITAKVCGRACDITFSPYTHGVF